MSTADGYYAASSGHHLYIRVVGSATMATALHLDTFVTAEIDSGTRQVYVDLSHCTGMDSTFMGTLVGVHNRMAREVGGRVVILNPSPANRRLLDMLGLTKVMPVLEQESLPHLAYVPIGQTGTQSYVKRMNRIKVAHENLVALSSRNQQQFSSFLEALEQDLSRLRRPSDADDSAAAGH
jgi:anti-anti-sigma factor